MLLYNIFSLKISYVATGDDCLRKRFRLPMNLPVNLLRSLLFLIMLGSFGGCSWLNWPKKANNPATTSAAVVSADTVVAPVWVPKKYGYNPSRTHKSDLLHTKLEVEFDWKKRQLLGVATLTLKPYFYPQNTLELDAKGFAIQSVKLLLTDHFKTLRYNYDNKKLAIYLDTIFHKNETYSVEIEYVAKPYDNDFVNSERGLFFINHDGSDPNKPQQIWTQGETESSSCWFPTIDSPNERCTQETHITVDSSFVTLSNGTLAYSTQNAGGTRTDVWEQKQPHAPYLFMMAVGKFSVIKDRWRNKEVNYYVEPKYAPYAQAIFGHTPEMMTFFSEKLGVDFPWDKYAQVVVRDFVSGAMENTSASTFMESVQCDDRALLDQHWDGIIAHELFHQWFGDLVTAESWANLPLNESFANYSEYLWAEHKYGVEEADYEAQNEKEAYFMEATYKREPLIRYYYGDKEKMFDSHSYAKGGRILHMLRKHLGDDAFFESLKRYLTKNQFTSVEIHQLRMAFEEVTGEDLNWFFNQWFMSAGHPELQVSYTYQPNKVLLTVRQTQDSLYAPKVYKLPLTVDIWTENQKHRYSIVVQQREQTFSLPAAAVPQLVLFDGEQQLLASVEQSKTEEEIIFQYYHCEKMKARYDALNAFASTENHEFSPAAKKMFTDALSDRFWGIRQTAVEYVDLTDSLSVVKLKDIATNDNKTQVRAAALAALAKLPSTTEIRNLLKANINEKSYRVSEAAFGGYIHSNAPDVPKMVAQLENTPAGEQFTAAIASYYAQKTDSVHNEWFVKKIKDTNNTWRVDCISHFGVYLMRINSTKKQKEGLQILMHLTGKENDTRTCFAAYQQLLRFPQLHEVAKEIHQAETRPDLRFLYDAISE